MQITIDLSTLVVVGGAISAALGAAYWAFRRVDDVGKIPHLLRVLLGDEKETRDSKIRLGVANRVDQIESAVVALAERVRGIQDGLDADGSKAHRIAKGVREGIAAQVHEASQAPPQRASETGPHRTLGDGWSELPAPVPMRRPALGVPREDPDSDQPPPRRRRPDGGE